MNYRHAFHAGNFADVVKHAVLARIILYMTQKEAPFRVIDTHAGAGLYDLRGEEASRTGEWHDGIGRVLPQVFGEPAKTLLAPYLDAVRAANRAGPLRQYPGSPCLALSWLRPRDRLIACELEAKAAAALARNLQSDRRAKAVVIDGWTALTAYIPPKERRGLVLIDPPFEASDEFQRLADALVAAWRKWPTGIYLVWYPIKDARACAAFARELAKSDISNLLQVELTLSPSESEKLRGSGLLIINPPWTLESELQVLLPALGKALGAGRNGGTKVQWLRADSR